ncbi:hypothetical protein GCM10011401_12940 [Nesterenkonia cremea]|uniref:Uncharacterized protein n=1 Tax=Nesterenkonia cremea TaxID=1882340 RepID=A0A917EQM1_9MICC|nr:hypothetical protein GCM10011401_12940 [Nesterenkonia cremea]
METGPAFLAESFDPPVGALAGDALGFGRVGGCPALFADTLNEQLPTAGTESGVTVGHGDLRTVDDLDIAHRTRRSLLRQ